MDKTCINCEYMDITDVELCDDGGALIESYCPGKEGMMQDINPCEIFKESKSNG